MRYEITGVYPAPSFFRIVSQNNGEGRIELTADLRKDSLQLNKYMVSQAVWLI